jgi:hypothetical protein
LLDNTITKWVMHVAVREVHGVCGHV